jgi:hypothetical protein
MAYYEKYLKYKNKYNELKNQIGGGDSSFFQMEYQEKIDRLIELENKYKNEEFEILCVSLGFKQHMGECWNDTIQMFFCFQDGIKEIVQRKFNFLSIDEIFEISELRGRKKFLPKIFQIEELYNDMKIKLKKYLLIMKNRFNIYYKRQLENRVYLFAPETPRLGINAAKEGLVCVDSEFVEDESESQVFGGNIYAQTEIQLSILLSYVLLDENDIIFNVKNLNNNIINEADINESIASFNSIETHNLNHATLFYKCNGRNLYFDNNQLLQEEFNYKIFLNKRNETILNSSPGVDKYKFVNLFIHYVGKSELYFYTNIIDNQHYYRIFTSFKLTSVGIKFDKNDLDRLSSLCLIKYNTFNKIDNEIKFNNLLLFEVNYLKKNIKYKDIIIKNIEEYLKYTKTSIDAFILSIIENYDEIIYKFIENGIDINSKIIFNETPLMIACEKNNLRLVERLIDRGAVLENKTLIGKTALFYAIHKNNLSIVNFLISRGANLNVINEYGTTPLILAIRNNSKDIVYELINNGANVNLTGKFKPLEVAKAQSIVNEDIIKKLIDNGAI